MGCHQLDTCAVEVILYILEEIVVDDMEVVGILDLNVSLVARIIIVML